MISIQLSRPLKVITDKKFTLVVDSAFIIIRLLL